MKKQGKHEGVHGVGKKFQSGLRAVEEEFEVFLNENGSASYKLDAWNSFLMKVTPESSKEDVYSIFTPLYEQCPEEAFK